MLKLRRYRGVIATRPKNAPRNCSYHPSNYGKWCFTVAQAERFEPVECNDVYEYHFYVEKR